MKWFSKTLILLVVSLPFAIHLAAEEASKIEEEAAPKGKDYKPWEAWDKFSPQMNILSRQLGVTCNHCHNTKNYRDQSNPNWKIGKKHIEIVDMLNDKYKTAFSEKVDCYMCHKGTAKPEFKEKPAKF